MKYTIVYTDCSAAKSGDFTAAAEIAFTLKHNFEFNAEHVCVISSSANGITLFKKLYGTSSNEITIHGEKFPVMDLTQLALASPTIEVINYIEVAFCLPASKFLLSHLINPYITKMVFVWLPHYPKSNNEEKLLKDKFRKICDVEGGFLNLIATGIGADREGIPFYQNSISKIDYNLYFPITTGSFGFLYYDYQKDNSASFILDYLRVATKVFKDCNQYFLVGNCSGAIEGIKFYAQNSGKIVQIFDFTYNDFYLISWNVNSGIEIKRKKLDATCHVSPINLNIGIKASLSNDQMRALINESILFNGSTGVSSEVEALAFGKITLYQYLDRNRIFISSYEKEVKESKKLNQQIADRLLYLHSWKKTLTDAEVDEFTNYLTNKKICRKFSLFNSNLIKNSAKKIVPALENTLNLKRKI